jgi:hypothetical protein
MGTWSQTGVPLAGVGCAALADHLRAASWPPKFRPHLPEKYDETSNPSEFLQVYVTAIIAAGGNTAMMVIVDVARSFVRYDNLIEWISRR